MGPLLEVSLTSGNSKISSIDNVYSNCKMKEGEMGALVHFKAMKEIDEENS